MTNDHKNYLAFSLKFITSVFCNASFGSRKKCPASNYEHFNHNKREISEETSQL